MSLDTILLRHTKERKSKCSLQPLLGKPGFVFWTWPLKSIPTIEGYIRLDPAGEPLGPADGGRGILLIDATWRLAEPMVAAFRGVPGRSIVGIKTAYPRRSKLHDEPEAGLASIEALYAAFVLTGRDPSGLLDGYHWAREFLSNNADRFHATQGAGR